MDKRFEIHLADYESILVKLAAVISANYVTGTFEQAEENFISSGKSTENWFLIGENGQLMITFEKYEGYYFSEFIATGNSFEEGKELIRMAYLAQGGNPRQL
jgi:hypothetical protein